jgi:hypothetical protein
MFATLMIATTATASLATAADLRATVQKPSVDVHAQAKLDSPKIKTLPRDSEVTITGQEGLWYQLKFDKPGYVRVNDVRIAYAGTEDGDANLRVLLKGKGGAGHATETAGVRGIDESDLKSASFNQAQLDAMVANRVDDKAASEYANEHRWQSTTVAFAAEAKPHKDDSTTASSAPASDVSKPALADAMGGVLGKFGVNVGSKLHTAAKAMPKSESELTAEELALGPEIAGRVLGARPLWADASAQQRVNRIGRWLASQTSRPELPWTFGVVDTPEVNAFAAPGGYILMTRGLYELLSSDAEVAAALGHEISHCVQRDHYNVIRKQELATAGKEAASSKIPAGSGSVAGNYARAYAEKYGASVMLTSLDREAEYRSDEAAGIYLARGGMNPLAVYAVLQKMAALGTKSASLVQLQKTHPALDERMDRIDQRGYAGIEYYLARE